MLSDIVVAISGGVGRIGKSFCEAIIQNGGKVIIGDILTKKGKELTKSLGEENACYFSGDLTMDDQIDSFITKGINKFGKINSAVHCAYPTSSQWGSKFEDLQKNELAYDLENQLGGAILFSQKFIEYFRNEGSGNLIHISSIQGISSPKFEHYKETKMVSPIEYSAIKAGVISLTRYLAKYCKGENIRVNCISPGGILDNQPKSFINNYRNSCNSKGLLDPSDINGTLLYLLSDQSKYVNGQNIIIDDGWSL